EPLEGLEDARGGRDGEVVGGRLSGASAGQRARLPGDEVARGQVPRVQTALVVAVEAAGGDVAQVDGRRAAAPDVPQQRDQPPRDVRLVVADVPHVVEAGRDQGLVEGRCGAAGQPALAVPGARRPRAPAADRVV